MSREGVETWMPMYVQDILVSTAAMSPAQFGGYVRLLLTAWANHESGGLPNDMEECCRIAGGLSPADWAKVRARFVVADPGTTEERLSHPRLEAEWGKAVGARDAKRRNLEKARAAKAEADSIHSSIHSPIHSPIHNPIHSLPSPSPSPSEEEDDSPTVNLAATRKPRRSYRLVWDADSGFAGITDADRAAWSKAYPGVNLDGELAKAHVYLRENPSKQGKRNWGSFLARWFARVQDKGGSSQAPSKAPSGWATKKYFRARFQANMTDAEYEAALRASSARQTAAQPAGGISTLSDVLTRYSASQEPQNGNYPD